MYGQTHYMWVIRIHYSSYCYCFWEIPEKMQIVLPNFPKRVEGGSDEKVNLYVDNDWLLSIENMHFNSWISILFKEIKLSAKSHFNLWKYFRFFILGFLFQCRCKNVNSVVRSIHLRYIIRYIIWINIFESPQNIFLYNT